MDREITSLEDALTLLDEWMAAHEELRIENVRLQHRMQKYKFSLDHAYDALENYEFLASLEQPDAERADAEGDPFS